jgi:pseudaminic acid biosynthesis-associated methylase
MSSDKFNTLQEEFWAGEFGDEYIARNESPELLSSNIAMFSKILATVDTLPTQVLEVGANVGMNIRALQQLLPGTEFTGVEINKAASERLKSTGCTVINASIADVELDANYDLVFTKGVLIHIAPEFLLGTYKKMYSLSRRWILIAEYYNPTPVGIPYRGHSDRLFKRDFAGEMLDLFPDLVLHDYGFSYHRGIYPQDDISWFLLEKMSQK